VDAWVLAFASIRRNGTKTWRAMRAYAWTPAFAGATKYPLIFCSPKPSTCVTQAMPARGTVNADATVAGAALGLARRIGR